MGQECKCRKRSTIAFFTWDFDNAYIDLLNKGITDAAIKYDVNLIIFPGRHLNTPIDYQYQENVIYDLVNYKNVDALMVPSGVFNYYLSPAEFNNFSKRYLPLPIVCLSHIMPGATNILLDNKKGLRDVLDHLILKHDRRRIVFLAGTSGNKETEERYFVYREALAEHNE